MAKKPNPPPKPARKAPAAVCGFRLRDNSYCDQPKATCHKHNQQRRGRGRPAGSPGKGTHRLYVRHLQADEVLAYEASRELLGSLDEELCLGRTQLDWAVGRWMGNPNGGIVTSRGPDATSYKLWVDVVREHQEIVRRLELVRDQLRANRGSSARGALHELIERLHQQVQADDRARAVDAADPATTDESLS